MPETPSRLAWWNGRLLPEDEVSIPSDDAGFLSGDGLFETLRLDDGKPGDLEAHLDRLTTGLTRIALALPEDRDALAAAVAAVAAAAPRPVARLRLTVTRGTSREPTRLITARPYEPPAPDAYARGVAAILLPDLRIDAQGPLAGLKSLSYQTNVLARRRAEEAGAWEALLLNHRGHLAEGARTNLIVVLDGQAWTPSLSDGCLPGTIRRRLLEQGLVAERSLSPSDLLQAEELLLTNSLVGVLPVGRLDARDLPVGKTARRLAGALER